MQHFGSPDLVQLAGYLACLLVFISFSMKSLIPLRIIAILSNIAFILYGFNAQLVPILILHISLLPLNIYRTIEQLRTMKQVRASARGNAKVEALIPFMRPIERAAGSYLFQKGDPASIIYYLSKGTAQIPEINKELPEGTLFGEVGLFTQERVRTASVKCLTKCQLHMISDTDIEKLCMKDPSFGLFLTKLIASRMAENQSRDSRAPSSDNANLNNT